LPFHGTAAARYRFLGRSWTYDDDEISDERLEELREIFVRHGVRTYLTGASPE
jgi:hypothetical protein